MKVRWPNFAIKLLRLTEDGDFLTVEEAAAYLRLNVKTLYRFAKQEKVPASKAGTQWRFSRAALEKYVRGRG
jgi:excisionase family DNA binding protein